MRKIWLALFALGFFAASGFAGDEATDRAAIEEAVMDYLRGYQDADREKLNKAFLVENAHMKGLTKNQAGETIVGIWELGPVIDRWASRDPRPQMNGKIISVDIVRGQAAQVIFDFDGSYIDLLQLMKVNGQWRIVNKVYVPVPKEEKP